MVVLAAALRRRRGKQLSDLFLGVLLLIVVGGGLAVRPAGTGRQRFLDGLLVRLGYRVPVSFFGRSGRYPRDDQIALRNEFGHSWRNSGSGDRARLYPVSAQLPSGTRILFLSAVAPYVGGARGMQLVGAPIDADTLRYNPITAAEKALEIVGSLLFLYALLRYMQILGEGLVRASVELN